MKFTQAARTLQPSEVAKYCEHLQRLQGEDRLLRFGAVVSNQWINNYTQHINFSQDCIKAFFEDSTIVAAIHISAYQTTEGRAAEVALSVEYQYRQKGLGTFLMEKAILWCRNRYILRIDAHWLSKNVAVTKMAKHFGVQVINNSQKSDAHLRMHLPNLAILTQEASEEKVVFLQADLSLNPSLTKQLVSYHQTFHN